MNDIKKYCIFDANVIADYYLPIDHHNRTVHCHSINIIESVRSKATNHFFYIPNFCIAEAFSAFAKHTYGEWNKQVKGKTLDQRIYLSLCKQFQKDIHNANLFYHYELTRYHILGINLISPIDHYFKLSRKKNSCPSGTFDQLIVSMGIHLTKIHGDGNVVVITSDNRLSKLINKCRQPISVSAATCIKIEKNERLVGIPFIPSSFPLVLNLANAKKNDLLSIFGRWPLPVAKKYTKPYHLKNY